MTGWEPSYLVPGLWLAALAAALGGALRRWWDGVPWRVWAVFALVVVALLGPALVAGGVQLPLEMLRGFAPWRELPASPWPVNRLQWDQLVEFAPWQATVRRALGAGEWPLWNATSGAGLPLLADPQSQVMQPLVVATHPLPLAAALGVIEALRVLTALVFTFLFLRRQGAGEGPAVAGSLVYGLSGFTLLWLGWPHATSAAMLPFVLYALAVSADRGARRDFALTAAAGFSLLVAGHPETAAYAALLAGAYAVSRLIERRPAGDGPPRPLLRRWTARWPLLARWALAGVVAFGAAAPALLPTFEFLPWTLRHHQAEERARILAGFDPLTKWRTAEGREEKLAELARRTVPIAAPNAYGNDRFGSYRGDGNINEDASGFAGAAALAAALLALVPLGRRGGGAPPGATRLRGERLMIAAWAVALVLIVKPPYLFEWAMRSPLGTWSSAWLHRVLLVVVFGTAFLAAATWERWRRGELPRWAPAAGAAAVATVVLWGYLGQPGARAAADPAALAGLRTTSMWVELAALGAWAVVGAMRGRRWAPAAVAVLIGVTAGELLYFHQPINPPAPRRLYYPATPAVEFLRERAGDQRVTATWLHLLPNSASVLGLRDLRDSSPVKPWPVRRLLLEARPARPERVEHVFALHHPLLDFFGVRWALTAPGDRLRRPWRRAFAGSDGWVWQQRKALPLIFLPRTTEPAEPAGEGWVKRVAANEDPEGLAYVFPRVPPWPADPAFAEGTTTTEPAGAGAPPTPWRAARPTGSVLSDLEIGRDRLRARAVLVEPRLLATSIFQDGGWRHLAGGTRRPTTWANGPFLAAWLPAGAWELEFLYRPAGFVAGCLAGALGLALAAAWFAAPPSPGAARSSPSQPRSSAAEAG